MYRFVCLIFVVVLLISCSQGSKTKLEFIVKYQGEIQTCPQLAPNLMFYLSNFEQETSLTIETSKFSNAAVALIGADCSESSWQLVLNEAVKSGQEISFDIGVPFEHNHSNPLTASSPLNISEMFWSWQLGHKFLRLDEENYSFHLGSTGCQSPSRLRPAQSECKHPNRFTFSVKNFQLHTPIIFDLDALVKDIDDSISCMSEQQNPNCQTLFSQLRTPLFYQE